MEIELVPDPGGDDAAARAARTAVARELAAREAGDGDWGLVPHSAAWARAALRDAVTRGDGLADDASGSAGSGSGSGARPSSS